MPEAITTTPDPAAVSAPVVDPAAGVAAPAVEPAKVEPAKVEPAKVEPAKVEPAKVVPEAYTAFKDHEGNDLPEKEQALAAAKAKELGLSQEEAQLRVQDVAPFMAEQNKQLAAAIETTKADWKKASAADPEFGGEKFDENLAVAKAALTLGSEALTSMLRETGLGDHPEVIRWMFKVGQMMQQDKHIPATKPTVTEDARKMYPNSNHAQ